MEQNLEHDNSLQKNFSERVVILHREKSNKCTQCDYASFRADNLRIHLKAHGGEKSNKCNQCDYATASVSALRTHLKMHSGEKPNKCKQCDYASSRAGVLKRHLKTHGGVKPTNATNVTMHLPLSVLWGLIRKLTMGESWAYAANVTMLSLKQTTQEFFFGNTALRIKTKTTDTGQKVKQMKPILFRILF